MAVWSCNSSFSPNSPHLLRCSLMIQSTLHIPHVQSIPRNIPRIIPLNQTPPYYFPIWAPLKNTNPHIYIYTWIILDIFGSLLFSRSMRCLDSGCYLVILCHKYGHMRIDASDPASEKPRVSRIDPTLNGNLTGQPFEVGHIEKQRNLASILKLQRAAKRLWDWRIS